MSNDLGYGTVVVVDVAPTSRGTVTLNSSDTAVLPLVNPNCAYRFSRWHSTSSVNNSLPGLATSVDQEVSVAGVKRMLQLFATDAMAPVLLSKDGVPMRNVTTDAEILSFAQSTGFQNWHAASMTSHVPCWSSTTLTRYV